MAPQMPPDEVKTSVHGNQGPARLFPASIYSISSPHSSTKHQCYWSPTLPPDFLFKCLCLCWSSYWMFFLPLTIWENPSWPSMDSLALLWSFPWPSTPRYILLNTHCFVPPKFLEPPSVMILSRGHYANSFPFLYLLQWAAWGHVLFTFGLSMRKPQPWWQRIKPYVSGSPLPYPPHLLPFSCLPTLILPQRLVFIQTCQIRSCPEPLHLVVPLRKMLLPRCSQNLLLDLSQMLSPQWAIPFPSNLKLQLYYPSSPAPHIHSLSFSLLFHFSP